MKLKYIILFLSCSFILCSCNKVKDYNNEMKELGESLVEVSSNTLNDADTIDSIFRNNVSKDIVDEAYSYIVSEYGFIFNSKEYKFPMKVSSLDCDNIDIPSLDLGARYYTDVNIDGEDVSIVVYNKESNDADVMDYNVSCIEFQSEGRAIELSDNHGVFIGMSELDVTDILGTPTGVTKDKWTYYEYINQYKGVCETVTFTDGSVSGIKIEYNAE